MNGAEKYKKIWDDTLKIFEQSGNVTGVIRPLKSARFKFFSPDDKTFYIETNDIFNAELLSDRATVQLTRILQGFTDNLDYLIKFIPPDSPTITEYAEIPAAPPTEKLINLTWVHNSIRDIVLQPEKVMSIPRYLFRWMPYTSPSAILLWISLYQIYYLKNSGKRIFDRDQSINTTYDEMSRWSGLSAITIKRMFKDGDKIKWFLNRGQNQYVTRPDGSVRPQLNIRFMKPGLTPGDASDLSNWLLAHNMISNPEECLKLALSKQPRDILEYPFRLPRPDDSTISNQPIGVSEIVTSLIGKHTDSVLSTLVESLSAHLGLSGSGDRFLTVSWYFMQNSVPLLGDSLAVFILFCRSLTYHNVVNGVNRNEFWINGGADSISALAGIKRDRVVDWFKPSQGTNGPRTERSDIELRSRSQKHALMEKYIQRLETRKNYDGEIDWHIYTNLEESLTPEDEKAVNICKSIISQSINNNNLPKLLEWANNMSGCFDTHDSSGVVELILTTCPSGCFDTHENILNGCFDINDMVKSGCFDTVLKILLNLKNTLSYENIPEEPPQDTSTHKKVNSMTDLNGGWKESEIKKLINSPEKRDFIFSNYSCIQFIAYLIAAVSNDSILKPVNYVVDQLTKSIPDTCPETAMSLAELPPGILIKFISDSLSYGVVIGNEELESLFINRISRLRMLEEILNSVLKVQKKGSKV